RGVAAGNLEPQGRNEELRLIIGGDGMGGLYVALGEDDVVVGEVDVVERQRVGAGHHRELDVDVLDPGRDVIVQTPRGKRGEKNLQAIQEEGLCGRQAADDGIPRRLDPEQRHFLEADQVRFLPGDL